VPNEFGNDVSAYSIGPDGALTPIAGSPFATGAQPISVAFTPKVPFASFFAKLKIEERHRAPTVFDPRGELDQMDVGRTTKF
jgi:hypothetical protein